MIDIRVADAAEGDEGADAEADALGDVPVEEGLGGDLLAVEVSGAEGPARDADAELRAAFLKDVEGVALEAFALGLGRGTVRLVMRL